MPDRSPGLPQLKADPLPLKGDRMEFHRYARRRGENRQFRGTMRRQSMAETKTAVANKPAWGDAETPDAAASRDFCSKVSAWNIKVEPNPQYGGYGMAEVGGKRAAGIGPKMSPEQPTAWTLYIGTDDADDLAKKVQAAGGKVIAPPFDVGDQGRMATFQDPTGAIISGWQPRAMNAAMPTGGLNTLGWARA